MSFFKPRKINRNYNLFTSYAFYACGVREMFGLLGWFIAGALLSNFVSGSLALLISSDFALSYAGVISYPIMFLPAMIFTAYQSKKNALFDNGYALNSNHFGDKRGWVIVLLSILAVLATSFITDIFNYILPPMPKWLETLLNSMTKGDLLLKFLFVSIMAPFFEEWLCRGEILRGLLNHKRTDGSSMKPIWAIIISAAFFALIHANPWQATPAFIIGLVLGFVYYKTGSLLLTMLMHSCNNAMALFFANFSLTKDASSWLDVLPVWEFSIICLICAVIIYFAIKTIDSIPLQSPRGNCDIVEVNTEIL